jgi:hypothetical protein
MNEAYRWDLWAAAAIIMEGCSESGFEEFRAWLIAQGRGVFEGALRDPETLAENEYLGAFDDDPQYPAFLTIPSGVHMRMAGKKTPIDPGVSKPGQPFGDKVVDDLGTVDAENIQALAARFPRLVKRFARDEWFEKKKPKPEYRLPPAMKKPIPPMPEEQFWGLIEKSRDAARRAKPKNGDDFLARQMEALSHLLRQLSPDQIIAYDLRFGELTGRAYRWELWGAAYWLHGGCGNDGFSDFRSTLISLGRELFERALADPDSIADMVGRPDVPYLQAEGFQYVPSRVYKEVTGYDLMPDVPGRERGAGGPPGKKFDFEDKAAMRQRYPRIVAKFPNMGD